MFKLYIDEDSMDRDLVRALRARGVDVSTAQEVGMMGRSDEDHLLFATGEGRVLCIVSTEVISIGCTHNWSLKTEAMRASC